MEDNGREEVDGKGKWTTAGRGDERKAKGSIIDTFAFVPGSLRGEGVRKEAGTPVPLWPGKAATESLRFWEKGSRRNGADSRMDTASTATCSQLKVTRSAACEESICSKMEIS